jgi:3-hydroxy-9,10-secoandrosta-1,3,5(10)-triene-9,17-dione monooxygenase
MNDMLRNVNLMEEIPTGDELVRRASAMIPMLRAQADVTERARRVPDETIQAFREAGFFKILQPRRWGGWEMSPLVFWRVLMELGRGCGSATWNMMILGVHQWEVALFDQRVGDEIWGENNEILVSSSYAPFGTAKKVDGGYIINGKWGTSSGCDHAQWAFVSTYVFNEQNQPDDRLVFLIPRSQYEFDDDWHVFGLAGTGSKSLVVKDVFVPDYRTHSTVDADYMERPLPYRFPFPFAFYSSVPAVLIGYAQGAIDVYIEQMKVRTNINGVPQAAMSPYVKDRLGNAASKVRSCRMRLTEIALEVTDYVSRGEPIPLDKRVHYTVDTARIGRECEEAVLLLYKATSARGIFMGNPIQRILRDTLVGANHITQNADDNAGVLGGYLLGQPDVLPPFMYGYPGQV